MSDKYINYYMAKEEEIPVIPAVFSRFDKHLGAMVFRGQAADGQLALNRKFQ